MRDTILSPVVYKKEISVSKNKDVNCRGRLYGQFAIDHRPLLVFIEADPKDSLISYLESNDNKDSPPLNSKAVAFELVKASMKLVKMKCF
ncbi:unnamed protein product [Brugia timori]|uniref:Uncharacterized protein n=1 Tax=Brugia timori TaxID=42155 RepID=A0A3P7Z455_9BILA|nr:unnamed protein product [Brugia timori]